MIGSMARTTGLTLAVALAGLINCGCTGGTQSSDQALNKALETTGGTKESVGKFAGIVTIDGKPPGNAGLVGVFVALWDPKKSPTSKKPTAYAPCDSDGKFEFTTYNQGDGVPTGSYIVCFAQLQKPSLNADGWLGPDRLKNLYNDPDKNKDNQKLVIEVAPPGKTDWDFNLEVAEKDPVANPGPNAFTAIH
jgi:hypothetical protein